MSEETEAIRFDVSAEHLRAIEALAGGRKVRLSGEVREGAFVVDGVSFANREFSQAVFLPVNAPFMTAREEARVGR